MLSAPFNLFFCGRLLFVWVRMCVRRVCVRVLTQRLLWNTFSGDKPLTGLWRSPSDSLIYLAALDGSDEMTTKIKPGVRTWGIAKALLDPLNMIKKKRRWCLIRADIWPGVQFPARVRPPPL